MLVSSLESTSIAAESGPSTVGRSTLSTKSGEWDGERPGGCTLERCEGEELGEGAAEDVCRVFSFLERLKWPHFGQTYSERKRLKFERIL